MNIESIIHKHTESLFRIDLGCEMDTSPKDYLIQWIKDNEAKIPERNVMIFKIIKRRFSDRARTRTTLHEYYYLVIDGRIVFTKSYGLHEFYRTFNFEGVIATAEYLLRWNQSLSTPRPKGLKGAENKLKKANKIYQILKDRDVIEDTEDQ